MKLIKFLAIFLIFSIIVITANADPAPSNVAASLRSKLKLSLPDLPVDQVNLSPINNVYEVVSGRKVFYVDTTGRYAMLGNMVDLNLKQSLTEQKVQSLSFVNWNQLPTKIAIIRVIGKGERKIAVFTDPDCPFCKRLDADAIANQKNLTVYYFLYPLAMHADAENDSKRILCAENPDQTYLDWMIDGKKLPIQSDCKRAMNLTQMKKVGKDIIGIEATPTIILPNGQIVSGLIPADYLDKLITDTTPVTVAKNESGLKSIATPSSHQKPESVAK